MEKIVLMAEWLPNIWLACSNTALLVYLWTDWLDELVVDACVRFVM